MNYIVLFTIIVVIVFCIFCTLDIFHDKKYLKKENIRYLVLSSLVYLLLQLLVTYLLPPTIAIVEFFQNKYRASIDSNSRYTIVLSIFLVTFYISTIADYLFHRFVSHSKFLWWSHEFHHLADRISLYMPGITIRPYSFIGRILTTAFTSALFFSLCYFFDYNNHINILYSIFTLQALILIVIHSSYLKDKRFFNASMRRLYLTSPEDHLLHHSYTTGYINYGNISILWDVLFKTYKKYSQNELYLAGTGIEKDYVESVTFGVFNLKKFLEKRSL